MKETGLTGEEPLPDEILPGERVALFEGAKRMITVNAYERNSVARQLCIKHHGAICVVCEFDFQERYGEHGKEFIQVHHLTPIAEIGERYEIDPIRDLWPVCPNCHAMLHRGPRLLTIEELKSMLLPWRSLINNSDEEKETNP